MSEEPRSYSVGEVADLTGVTIRTLHHYDRIGLLRPGGRQANGYRRYTGADLERLHQILFYRELGFVLADIDTVLAEQGNDRLAHLRRQHGLLSAAIERQQRMLAAVEKEMEAHQMGISLTPEERFELWGDFDPDEHAVEAKERWGDTDAYKESSRRTSSYTKDDWRAIKDEAAAIERGLAEALRAGEKPEGGRAMDLAERHRRHISGWFYECGYAMHRGLAQMYVADPRFTAHYDDIEPGLAAFVSAAIEANAARSA